MCVRDDVGIEVYKSVFFSKKKKKKRKKKVKIIGECLNGPNGKRKNLIKKKKYIP